MMWWSKKETPAEPKPLTRKEQVELMTFEQLTAEHNGSALDALKEIRSLGIRWFPLAFILPVVEELEAKIAGLDERLKASNL
jgi:hypothetical protein